MDPQLTPEEELRQQLDELAHRYHPERWSGPREEIEIAYAGIEYQMLEQQKQEMKGFLQGYEEREIQTRTGEIVQRLDGHMRGLRPDHQWGSQNAINGVKTGVARDLAENAFYQEAKEEAGRELAYRQAELLTQLYDHEASTLQANGYEPHMEPRAELIQEPSPEQLVRAEAALEQAREGIVQEREELPAATRNAGGMTRDAFHSLVLAGQELERENER